MSKYAALTIAKDADGKATASVAMIAKTAKWKNNPITDPHNTEQFFDYLLSVMKAGDNIAEFEPVIKAIKAADLLQDRKTAIEAVGERYCEDMIKYAANNDKELPSAAYIKTRLPQKPGEQSVEKAQQHQTAQSSCVPQNETDAETTPHVEI